MDVRRLTFAHVRAVEAIERQSFDEPWPWEALVHEIGKANADSICLGAFDDDDILRGFLLVGRSGESWHVLDIAVDPTARNDGIGAALLRRLFEITDDSSLGYTAEVSVKNVASLALARAAGFRESGRDPKGADDGGEAILLWKDPIGAPKPRTEPSRRSAGRRARNLRAFSRELDERFGPDESEVVYTFADGWTIRFVDRLEDQLREGNLLRHCGIGLTRRDENCWSLRDPGNLPHATFATWRIGPEDDLSEIPREPFFEGTRFLFAPRALFLIGGRSGQPLKDTYCRRLVEFGGSSEVDQAERLPADPDARLSRVGRALTPALTNDMLVYAGVPR